MSQIIVRALALAVMIAEPAVLTAQENASGITVPTTPTLAGTRQTREQMAPNAIPAARIQNRVENRVDARIENRMGRVTQFDSTAAIEAAQYLSQRTTSTKP